MIPRPITHSHANTLYHTIEHRTRDFPRSPHLSDAAPGLTQTFTLGSSTALTTVSYGSLHSSCTGRKKALCVNQNFGLIPALELASLTLELDSTSRAPSALDLAQSYSHFTSTLGR